MHSLLHRITYSTIVVVSREFMSHLIKKMGPLWGTNGSYFPVLTCATDEVMSVEKKNFSMSTQNVIWLKLLINSIAKTQKQKQQETMIAWNADVTKEKCTNPKQEHLVFNSIGTCFR